MQANISFMFFPFISSTHKSVLHILKLVCWAPTQYQNTPMLELNGYEQRPIAALIKSLFSNHDQFTRNKSEYFSGPVKVRALKNAKSIRILGYKAARPTHRKCSTEKWKEKGRGTTALASKLLFPMNR